MAFQLDWDEALHTDYVIHDVANKETWKSPSKIAKADLITINFFVSEIYHLKFAEEYLTTMLKQAKSGAIVLMNDNRTKEVYALMDKIAAKCGFETLVSDEGERKIYDGGEDMSTLKKYRAKCGTASKLTGNMSWRIYRKK